MAPTKSTVLFLCTGNSARSIIAEAILNHRGGERFAALSAGSHPTGEINPFALELLESRALVSEDQHSKNWDEFAGDDAPALDMIITVCDNAAAESCPVWPGAPITAHWGVPDPAAVEGNEAMRRAAFDATYMELNDKISALLRLSNDEISQQALQKIGNRG